MPSVSKKGQVTIPKKWREKLGITPGDEIKFVEKNGDLVVKKKGKDFSDYEGFLGEKKTDEHMERLRG